MKECNQEGYQTLEWIMNVSDDGLFLAIADEMIQNEIINFYHDGGVGIYNYQQHSGGYSFDKLYDWIVSLPEIQTFLIFHLQLALKDENDLKRINFSRDMMAKLKKNIIFFTTINGDDKLATGAYDFYSFIKLRIFFSECKRV